MIDHVTALTHSESLVSLAVHWMLPNPQACELVHSHLRSSGTEYGSRRAQAMAQQSAKRIPEWLTIDSLVIVVGLAIFGIVIWIAP